MAEVEAYSLRTRTVIKTELSRSPPSKKTKKSKRDGDGDGDGDGGSGKLFFDTDFPPPDYSGMKPIGVMPVVTEGDLRFNRESWAIWSTKALERYYLMEHANFSFLESMGVQLNLLYPRFLVHMNFKAQSANDSSIRLFYAELRVVWGNAEVTEVTGCCLLEKIDSGSSEGKLCGLCKNAVIHPGPRYGYRNAGGDDFSNSYFSS